MSIRYTVKTIISNAARVLIEDRMPAGTCVLNEAPASVVLTLDVDRDLVTTVGESRAIRETLEDGCGDITVRQVQVLEAQCQECYSNAPHRCDCVTAAGWTDDLEVA